ncbi:ketopantoate reductase family protein [Halalkalibacter krulwichiae]|uniref:2-dehydropantoate 2-reductase n=1 Tax=Halalkalibacter krulwichiae TaxID=199441 RepID=A0A1X9MKP1_9BACI|nr:2-dehydropantoate 2-reductase [Halalkalibacter krulwichiae]ARK32873.1 2-dehydropantoate 2-reductase [Halalkalibacter krulwichiae]
MNILVHGAGALGAYFGGRLLESGQNVSFFVREKRAGQLKERGLKINSPEGRFEEKDLTIYTKPEEVESIDLIILAVKGYHLEQAISQIQTIVRQTGAFVLPLLNGIEHVETLQQAVGKVKVIGGFASIIATLTEDGYVEHTSASGTIKFGILHEEQKEICKQLEEIHSHAKMNLIREEIILKHMWKKYIFITAFSGITSAMQLPAGFINKSQASFKAAKNVIYEMSKLARLEGITLSDQEVDVMANRLKGFQEEATSSMHQDMRKGLFIEVEHLHGAALRIADKHDSSIPVTETLYGVLKPYEHGNPNW